MKGFFGSGRGAGGQATTVDTLIGRQTEILGDVRFAGGLHVDGRIKGTILTASGDKTASLSLSESGVVEGDVRVPTVMLNGTVIGDVHACERLVLNVKARITGNVYYKLLQMEPGAAINGQLVHELDEPAAEAHLVRHKALEGKTESAVLDIQDARRSKSA